MEKKSKKMVAKVVMVLFALMMVFALTGCEKAEDKYLKDLEQLVEKLETAVRAEDIDNYNQILKEINNLPLNEKYKDFSIITDLSEKNVSKLSALTSRIATAATNIQEIISNNYLTDLESLVTKLEATLETGAEDVYDKISEEIVNLPITEKYKDFPVITDLSEKNVSKLSALLDRIAAVDDVRNIVGSYILDHLISDGETMTFKDLKDIYAAYGMDCPEFSLVLNKDRTGKMTLNGESVNIKWDDKSKTMTSNGESISYSFKDKKITLSENGEVMIFVKK